MIKACSKRRWSKKVSYEKELAKLKGEYPALPTSLQRTDPKKFNRLKGIRREWRRRNQAEKYEKFGKWVRSIRNRMKKTQGEFARLLGVSEITVRRWERAYGCMAADWPRRDGRGKQQLSTMERLENLDRMLKDFKKKGIPLESGINAAD